MDALRVARQRLNAARDRCEHEETDRRFPRRRSVRLRHALQACAARRELRHRCARRRVVRHARSPAKEKGVRRYALRRSAGAAPCLRRGSVRQKQSSWGALRAGLRHAATQKVGSEGRLRIRRTPRWWTRGDGEKESGSQDSRGGLENGSGERFGRRGELKRSATGESCAWSGATEAVVHSVVEANASLYAAKSRRF